MRLNASTHGALEMQTPHNQTISVSSNVADDMLFNLNTYKTATTTTNPIVFKYSFKRFSKVSSLSEKHVMTSL
jgi:hypothetical protein